MNKLFSTKTLDITLTWPFIIAAGALGYAAVRRQPVGLTCGLGSERWGALWSPSRKSRRLPSPTNTQRA
jgi:hypothetical protein